VYEEVYATEIRQEDTARPRESGEWTTEGYRLSTACIGWDGIKELYHFLHLRVRADTSHLSSRLIPNHLRDLFLAENSQSTRRPDPRRQLQLHLHH